MAVRLMDGDRGGSRHTGVGAGFCGRPALAAGACAAGKPHSRIASIIYAVLFLRACHAPYAAAAGGQVLASRLATSVPLYLLETAKQHLYAPGCVWFLSQPLTHHVSQVIYRVVLNSPESLPLPCAAQVQSTGGPLPTHQAELGVDCCINADVYCLLSC